MNIAVVLKKLLHKSDTIYAKGHPSHELQNVRILR